MIRKLAVLSSCLTLALVASDVSGKWSGTIEIADTGGGLMQTAVRVELVQKSETVSGKIGRPGDDEAQIRNGKVEGPRVSFEVSSAETTTPMRFTLRLVGDRLEGEMKGSIEEGEIVGRVTLSREKADAGSH